MAFGVDKYDKFVKFNKNTSVRNKITKKYTHKMSHCNDRLSADTFQPFI